MDSKPFDRELYNQHNQPTIDIAIRFLEKLGYKTIDVREAFKSHDFIVQKKGKQYKIEVEHSLSWITPGYYENITCPYRKRASKADFYLMFNKLYSYVAVINMQIVHNSPVIRKDTKYTKNEPFFSTHYCLYDFYNLNETIPEESRYLL